MLTRRLSQRVLTLSLPKVNRRKRRKLRYFCVLTRRCASRARPRGRIGHDETLGEWLYSHRKGGSTTGVAGRPVRGWRRPLRRKSQRQMQRVDRAGWWGGESHNFRLRRPEKERFVPLGTGPSRPSQIFRLSKRIPGVA